MKLKLTSIIISLLLLTSCAAGQALREVNRADYKLGVIATSFIVDVNKDLRKVFRKTPPKDKQYIEKAVEDAVDVHFDTIWEKVYPMVKSTITDYDLQQKVLDMYRGNLGDFFLKITEAFVKDYSKKYNIK